MSRNESVTPTPHFYGVPSRPGFALATKTGLRPCGVCPAKAPVTDSLRNSGISPNLGNTFFSLLDQRFYTACVCGNVVPTACANALPFEFVLDQGEQGSGPEQLPYNFRLRRKLKPSAPLCKQQGLQGNDRRKF